MRKLILFSLFVVIASCANLNSRHKEQITEMKAKGYYVEEKSPGLAAGLNVLPGIGNFYNGEIGYGVVNLLAWPLSIFWAPIGAKNGAMLRNLEESKINQARQERKVASDKK